MVCHSTCVWRNTSSDADAIRLCVYACRRPSNAVGGGLVMLKMLNRLCWGVKGKVLDRARVCVDRPSCYWHIINTVDADQNHLQSIIPDYSSSISTHHLHWDLSGSRSTQIPLLSFWKKVESSHHTVDRVDGLETDSSPARLQWLLSQQAISWSDLSFPDATALWIELFSFMLQFSPK